MSRSFGQQGGEKCLISIGINTITLMQRYAVGIFMHL